MLRGGRGVLAAFAGLAALFTALGTGAYFGTLSAPHYGYQATHPTYRSSHAEQSDPSQIDRDRAGLPYFAERIASGADPADADEREKRDLAAQESMSVWAFWLLLVSGAGTVTTMIGTGFLLWQIILTRKAVEDTGEATEAMREANEIARQSSERQLRAYLSVTGVEFGGARSPGRLRATVNFLNTGQTPAKDVRVHLNIYVLKWDEYRSTVLPDTSSTGIKSSAVVGSGGMQSISNDVGLVEGVDLKQALNELCLIASGFIRYQDIFGVEHETTYKIFKDNVTRRLGHDTVAAPDGNDVT